MMKVTKSPKISISYLKSSDVLLLNELSFDALGQLVKTEKLEKEIVKNAQVLLNCSNICKFFVVYKKESVSNKSKIYFVCYESVGDTLNTGYVM